MEKNYSPAQIEEHCYKVWESHRYFEPHGDKEPFCIMLPPPNVTGSLHMGHGFQHTLIDTMIRYQRMMGRRTLWQPGTDHAGISTQLVVERQLERQGLSRQDFTRDDFVEKIWEWKAESGHQITQQMRRLGASADWSRERFTLDKGLSIAVQKVFIQLYEEGLIYKSNRLVNWDPQLGTAVSDLEVITEEENAFLWHIRYPIVNSQESVVVATTRPETLFGDCAVAVHPDDERYQPLIGQYIQLPLTQRTIPIIADSSIDPAFGTGCVKITPAHDFNDYEIGKRHQLPQINILTKQAILNDRVPSAYQGLERFEARNRVIADLTEQGLLVETKPHISKIPRGEKSNVIIEPLLTEQWYVRMQPLAKPAIEAVLQEKIRFVPDNWKKTYFQWMENIEDWCISRQLWWGHRIPAWYDAQGQIYVGYTEKDVRFKYQLDPALELTQDEDVLDTWFSSALWPFSSLGWPEQTLDLEQFYPTNTLFTGFDIIFFWVARMIMMGLKFTGKIPFSDVVISGLICDHNGKKMSKSKGNVLDPIDIIDGISLEALLEKRTQHLLLNSVRDSTVKQTKKQFPQGIPAYGADALRFTFCALGSNVRHVRFDVNRVDGYRNFCNKLWNATRFILMSVDQDNGDFEEGAFQYSPADEWILSLLQNVIARCHEHFAQYRFDLLAQELYEFVWHEYCDWYLEFSKVVLFDKTAKAPIKRGTQITLIHVLTQILKLLHPCMPFITEYLWQQIQRVNPEEDTESIMMCRYPMVQETLIHNIAEEKMAWIKSLIQVIRTLRSEIGISPGQSIPILLRNLTLQQHDLIYHHQHTLYTLAKLNHIELSDAPVDNTIYASSVLGTAEVLIPMLGLIDKQAELIRLDKELNKLAKDIEFAERKLNSSDFQAKAPADLIQTTQDKLQTAKIASEKLQQHRAKILLLEDIM